MKATGQKIKVLMFVIVFCFYFWGAFAWSANLILQPSHGGDGSAWAKSQCDSCHPVNFIHRNTAENLRNLVQEKSYASCAGCHGSNGTNSTRQCTICHNENDLPYASKQVGSNSHNRTKPDSLQTNTQLTDENCLSCHDSADMNGIFDINDDLTQLSNQSNYQHGSEFCLSCHKMQDSYYVKDKHGFPKGSGLSPYSGLKDNYSYGSVVECTDCHAMHGTHNETLLISNSDNGLAQLLKQLKDKGTVIKTSTGKVAQLCVTCHKMDNILGEGAIDTGNGLSGVHRVAGSCNNCHRHNMVAQPMLKSMDLPNSLILNNNHGGDGSAWGNPQCDSCHLLKYIHQNTTSKIQKLVKEKGYPSCAGCHGNNGTQVLRQCTICHNKTDLTYISGQQGENSHNFVASDDQQQGMALNDQNCLSCHLSSNMDGHFDFNVDLTLLINQYGSYTKYKKSSDFCLACHNRKYQQAGFEIEDKDYRNPLVAMKDNYAFIDKHGVPKGSGLRTFSGLREAYNYASEVACTDCHAMHGTHNDSLIIGNVAHGASRLSPAIKQQDITINSNNGQLAQLCVICHAMDEQIDDAQIDTGNGLSGVHKAQGDCLACHRHGMAVQTGL